MLQEKFCLDLGYDLEYFGQKQIDNLLFKELKKRHYQEMDFVKAKIVKDEYL